MVRGTARSVAVAASCSLLAGCASAPTPVGAPPRAPHGAEAPTARACTPTLTYRFAHGTADEKATAVQLDALLCVHDLGPWLYTREITIDADAIPHSHPTLTLHTRHRKDDLLLLSTFIHEQSHRYVDAHPVDLDAAVKDLRVMAPGMPVGYPDGADTEVSDYEHFAVIALEERGLIRLVGELQAHEALSFWAHDHYRVVYKTYLERRNDVWRILRAHGLASPGEEGRAP